MLLRKKLNFMSKVTKNKHIYIDFDIANEISERAKKKGINETEEYNNLLKYSLEFEKIFEKLNIMLKIVEKNNENTYYIRKLLEQTYTDLNLPIRDSRISNNLREFNDKYHKNKRRLSE